MPSFTFPRALGAPLTDVTVCTICAPYECAVSPDALSSAGPEGRQHHACVQQLVLSSLLGALLNCCCPVTQDAFCLDSLLVRLECYLVGENMGIIIWLLGLVFCHATYTSYGPEFLINSSTNELNF